MADQRTPTSRRMTLTAQAPAAPGDPPHAEAAVDRLARVEAEFDRLSRELEHAQRLAMLGTLAACTAHEINNLLSPILFTTQAARANPADGELARRAIARTVEGVMAVAEIVDTVLGFAAPADEDICCADVRQAIDGALRCLGRDPAKEGIVLTVDAERGVTAAISPRALQQIILNLLLNAIEALRQVETRRLEIIATPQGDDVILITVRDSGPGVPAELRDQLFQPFAPTRRASGSAMTRTAGNSGGHGLGLAVCKRLIERFGGSIELDACRTHGASFTIVIPNIYQSLLA